jgi:hypothetical protein
MSEHIWARFGQIFTGLSGMGGLVALLTWLNLPSNSLIADIRPVSFRLPFTAGAIGEIVKTCTDVAKTCPPVAGHLLGITRVNGFVTVDLHNTGDIPINNVQVFVKNAVLYAKVTEGVDDSNLVGFDENGTSVASLTQGSSLTIYAWTSTFTGAYRSWWNLSDQFRVSFSQGVATKHIYIEGSLISGWIERNGNWLPLILLAFPLTTLAIGVVRSRSRTLPDEKPSQS